MPVGVTLGQLVDEVKLEMGSSDSPNISAAFRPHIVHQLNNAQRHYHRQYAWPHLKDFTTIETFFDKLTVAGQNLYDFPSELDASSIVRVWFDYGGPSWLELEKGISVEDYNSFDSDDVEVTADPALKWRPVNGEQFEIWPRPGTAGYTVRFEGRRELSSLVNDADACVLDSDMIVCRAAGILMRRKDKTIASDLLTRAEETYRTLRYNQDSKVKTNMAGGASDKPARMPRILVAK